MLNKVKFDSLDSGTQFKIFDRMMKRAKELTAKQLENKAMEEFAGILLEETEAALAENAGKCEECGNDAEAMEWQEFDKIFVCPDCGHCQ